MACHRPTLSEPVITTFDRAHNYEHLYSPLLADNQETNKQENK